MKSVIFEMQFLSLWSKISWKLAHFENQLKLQFYNENKFYKFQ